MNNISAAFERAIRDIGKAQRVKPGSYVLHTSDGSTWDIDKCDISDGECEGWHVMQHEMEWEGESYSTLREAVAEQVRYAQMFVEEETRTDFSVGDCNKRITLDEFNDATRYHSSPQTGRSWYTTQIFHADHAHQYQDEDNHNIRLQMEREGWVFLSRQIKKRRSPRWYLEANVYNKCRALFGPYPRKLLAQGACNHNTNYYAMVKDVTFQVITHTEARRVFEDDFEKLLRPPVAQVSPQALGIVTRERVGS